MENPHPQNQSTAKVAFSIKSLLSGLFFLLIWIGLVYVRTKVDPNHYQTIDGTYYQELREDFMAGRPMVLEGLSNQTGKDFSPYPPGFPILLALEKQVFPDGLSPFPAGFSIQVLFALLLLALAIWSGLPGWIPGVVLLGDGFLEISCHTWSEGPFCLLAVCWILIQFKRAPSWIWVLNFLLLFSIRYAAVFLLPAYVILLLRFRKEAFGKWKPIWFSLILVCGWLAFETWRTGLPTGGDRYFNQEPWQKLLPNLANGLVNQFAFFRDWAGTTAGPMFWIGLGFQCLFSIWIFRSIWKSDTRPTSPPALSFIFLVSGLGYLVQIMALRWWYYFAEGFDNRLLIPGGLLLWTGCWLWIWERGFRPGFWFWLAFCLTAIGFGLPKTALILQLQEWIWGQTGPVFGYSYFP